MSFAITSAGQSYGFTKSLGLEPTVSSDTPAVAKAAQSFAETLRNAETTSQEALLQKTDTHDLVHTLAQTELAVEAAVTIRNKVVEAYQEILRMPV